MNSQLSPASPDCGSQHLPTSRSVEEVAGARGRLGVTAQRLVPSEGSVHVLEEDLPGSQPEADFCPFPSHNLSSFLWRREEAGALVPNQENLLLSC